MGCDLREVVEGSGDHLTSRSCPSLAPQGRVWPSRPSVCAVPHPTSLVPTACLLVHKREARERRQRNPKSPAGSWLAALVRGWLQRKTKFLIQLRLPFMEAGRSQLCFP